MTNFKYSPYPEQNISESIQVALIEGQPETKNIKTFIFKSLDVEQKSVTRLEKQVEGWVLANCEVGYTYGQPINQIALGDQAENESGVKLLNGRSVALYLPEKTNTTALIAVVKVFSKYGIPFWVIPIDNNGNYSETQSVSWVF